VLLTSTVLETDRGATGVKLIVGTPTGGDVIKAKKLLITAALTVDNLCKPDLDLTEVSVFKKWQRSSN
jgi:hypothetical protein